MSTAPGGTGKRAAPGESEGRRPTATRRRVRFGAMTGAVFVAMTASVVIVNVLAERFSARVDVTATREHRLAPRTLQLLGSISEPYEFVLALNPGAVDRRALERVRDALDQFRRASGRIATTLIDTGSEAGLAQYESLLARLAAREEPKMRAQAETIGRAADGLESLIAYLESLSTRLLQVRDAIPPPPPGAPPNAATNRAYFEQRAAVARLTARSLAESVTAARAAVSARRIGAVAIPDTDEAQQALAEPFRSLASDLGALAANLTEFAEADATVAPPAARDLARPLAAEAARRRDSAALLGESIARLERLDLLRVARVLESTDAALVIGPPDAGLTAISFDALFPATEILEASAGGQADLQRSSEELLATALGSLANPIKPIVVIMHGEGGRFIDRTLVGRRPVIDRLEERLALRGIDLVEWAAAVEPEPPTALISPLDPEGNRPVVYVSLSTNATDASRTDGGGEQGMSGPQRAAKLGAEIAWVVESGHPLLLSVAPSTLPTFGEPDPMVAALSRFGLRADSARPLLTEHFSQAGRTVDTELLLTPAESTLSTATTPHPLFSAIRGLPTLFTWPIAIKPADEPPPSPDGEVTVTPLYVIGDGTTWGESQWLSLWQTRREDRPRLPNLPENDSQRDDPTGPWTIAAAVEAPGGSVDDSTSPRPSQRLVVVGSNGWYIDSITQQQVLVDGRVASANPGNLELFEAAVLWLAGQDDLIAQSATARAVPLIRPLEDGTLRLLRWLVIGGLPVLVLLVGGLWRALRG